MTYYQSWVFKQPKEAPLERDQELELVTAAQAGDRAALDRLWCYAGPYATAMALPCAQRWNFDLGDLLGEMAIGFMKAVERFDPKAGYRLLAYAGWWFRDRLWTFAKRFRRGSIDMTLTERERVAFKDISTNGISDAESIRARHGMLLRTVENALAAYVAREVPIDAPPAGEGRPHTDVCLPSHEPTAAEWMERAENEQRRLDALDLALTTLPPRSRSILLLRMVEAPSTFKELGPVFGVKRQRVQQIERQALWDVTQKVCELLGVPVPRDAKRPLQRRMVCSHCAKIGLPAEGHARIRCPKRVGPDGRPRSRRRRKVVPTSAAA